jgi:hypothetical protein
MLRLSGIFMATILVVFAVYGVSPCPYTSTSSIARE